ncbi:MAG: hypothetical protein WDW38_003293 [Sanguina aurantia]
MEQFFGLVSQVLGRNREACARKLRLITYKVVPFSPNAGLVEWVGNTLAVSEYLIGKDQWRVTGAHTRFKRPGDYDFAFAFNELGKHAMPERRRVYDDILAHYQPVMHHFFTETYRDPAVWFERKVAYTRSVAVNSMAGYIIGLGDRHGGNILLSCSTAEVVHIDLGVAFEQGRFLTTPEVVPFRLTRDIVDGMGVNGVEGVMRRCCELTLQVLRASQDSLLTVLEVVLHDPQYKWALTPVMVQKRQRDSSQAGQGGSSRHETEGTARGMPHLEETQYSADAERAIMRVKQKLEGTDGAEGRLRTIPGQVAALLREASDPDKLCRMYAGWAPFV